MLDIIYSLRIRVGLVQNRHEILPEILRTNRTNDERLSAACKSGDAKPAERLMREHINALQEMFVRFIAS